MTYDPQNKALEALETERDDLRIKLAEARKVIASGYGTCSTCKHWAVNDDPPNGECDALGPNGRIGAWADGYEVEEIGFSSPPDFGCTLHETGRSGAAPLAALEIREINVSSS